jgi:hypothetical protein
MSMRQCASIVPYSANSRSSPHEPVVELAGLDLEWLHVPGDLLAVAVVDDLERTSSGVIDRASHDDDEVRLDRARHRAGCRSRELHTDQVDPGRRARNGAQVDAVDEQGGDDLHGAGP